MSYHHGNLKDALVMAAENLIEHDDIKEISLRQTAQLAGVSHNAPYRHFKSKTALIDEVLQKTLTDIAEKILKAPLIYSVSLTMQLQHVGRMIMQIAWRSPRRAHLVFSYQSPTADTSPALTAAFELTRQNLIIILGESHELDDAAANANTLALQLIACWRGLAMMHSSGLHLTQISSEEELFDHSDKLTENILKSFMR